MKKEDYIKFLIYFCITYICLIPTQKWIINIGISILIGALFGALNEIILQLKKLNKKS